jgi:hypothetical protein
MRKKGNVLEKFRKEERNHFLSESYRNEDIVWDDSDEDEEDGEDTVEIIGVHTSKQGFGATIIQQNVRNSSMENVEFEVDDFMESDDEEMGEAAPETFQSEKKKQTMNKSQKTLIMKWSKTVGRLLPIKRKP